jgi:hypothetical protein
MLNILFKFFYQTSYFNEEVNCTDPSPSVSIPCDTDYLSDPAHCLAKPTCLDGPSTMLAQLPCLCQGILKGEVSLFDWFGLVFFANKNKNCQL